MLLTSKVKSIFSVILQLVAFLFLFEAIYYRLTPNEPYYPWQKIIETWDYPFIAACLFVFFNLLISETPAKKELPTDIYVKK